MGTKILEEINGKKGITLNSQLVDLLSILDKDISNEEQDKEINSYLENLKELQKQYREAKQKGRAELYKFMLDKVIDSIDEIPEDEKDNIKELYLSSMEDMSIFDAKQMEDKLSENGLKSSLNEIIQKQVKNMDFETKDGLEKLTPGKVRNFYSHMFKDGKAQYDRVTIDNAGKYSSYVCVDGTNYADERLNKVISFAERHGMKSKVNALMHYADYPKHLEGVYTKKAYEMNLSEHGKVKYIKSNLKESLNSYVRHVSEKYGDRIDEVDIFNELIYDPVMLESGFEEPEKTFHEREAGWQKYLDLEDLCEMALIARKSMPEVTFTYNDMNWINPEKRKELIKVVKEIKKIESRYREEGKLEEDETLIDAIGFEAHLTTSDKIEDIEETFRDVEQIGLPIKVTELDIARVGKDPNSVGELARQNAIIQKIIDVYKEGRIEDLTFWSQSDELSFVNDKCGRMVYASAILDENCEEKQLERQNSYTITPQQIGKSTVAHNIEQKDSAKEVVNKTLMEKESLKENQTHNQ